MKGALEKGGNYSRNNQPIYSWFTNLGKSLLTTVGGAAAEKLACLGWFYEPKVPETLRKRAGTQTEQPKVLAIMVEKRSGKNIVAASKGRGGLCGRLVAYY